VVALLSGRNTKSTTQCDHKMRTLDSCDIKDEKQKDTACFNGGENIMSASLVKTKQKNGRLLPLLPLPPRLISNFGTICYLAASFFAVRFERTIDRLRSAVIVLSVFFGPAVVGVRTRRLRHSRSHLQSHNSSGPTVRLNPSMKERFSLYSSGDEKTRFIQRENETKNVDDRLVSGR